MKRVLKLPIALLFIVIVFPIMFVPLTWGMTKEDLTPKRIKQAFLESMKQAWEMLTE